MLAPPKFDMMEIIFGSLRFMRENAAVFRKYYFLPLVFSIVGLFVEQVPIIGMAGGIICQSISMALISVSVTRFYFLRDAEQVAEGAQIPFARVFFLTFLVAALSQVSSIFELVPENMRGALGFLVALYLWINLKITFSYPAMAMNQTDSFGTLIKRSYGETSGHLLKIILIAIICYIPVMFFLMMLSNVVEAPQLLENFWGNLPHLIFLDLIVVFCVLWFTLSMARLYEAVQAQSPSS